jgi:hypothetical protein
MLFFILHPLKWNNLKKMIEIILCYYIIIYIIININKLKIKMDKLPFQLWFEIISYLDSSKNELSKKKILTKNELIFMIDKHYLNNIKLDIYTYFYLNNKNNLMNEYNIFFMNKNKKNELELILEADRRREDYWRRAFLPKDIDNIDWFSLSTRTPRAIALLENNLEYINWDTFSKDKK